MDTGGKSLHAPNLTKTRDDAVRQSRLSPARELEQPRPLGFTVTGQTFERGEGAGVKTGALKQSGQLRSCKTGCTINWTRKVKNKKL